MNNPYKQQVSRYDRTPEPGSPRQTEAWALLEAAKRMAVAITHGDDDDRETRELRKSALRLNWRLWTIFQSELTQERPDMPSDLQINMLTLCQFVDKHTVSALVTPTAESLSVLIDLNRNIALGLMDMPETEEGNQKAADNDQAPPDAPLQSFDAEV